jgi:predicted metal-dependent hydrolase
MLWRRLKRRVVRKRATTVTKHYVLHKEMARSFVLERLNHFNEYYKLSWNRVAIRNQRRCWGSCSANKNLNFNYKILFLPPHLADYIIVHELCHLTHLHHGKEFWDLVAEVLPEYPRLLRELREIDKKGHQSLLQQKTLATFSGGEG